MKTKLGILTLMVIMPLSLFADPAMKVPVTYDKETKKLHIVALHPTTNVTAHFIDEVKIKVDGKEVKDLKLKKQSSLKEEVLDVEIADIKTGSKIEVNTHCNQSGNKTGKLTVK